MNFDPSLSYFEGLGNEAPTVVTKKINLRKKNLTKRF